MPADLTVRAATDAAVTRSGAQVLDGLALIAYTQEVSRLTVTSAADADGGNVEVTLGNVDGTTSTTYAVAVAAADSAITVANKVANLAGGYAGWTAAQRAAPDDNQVDFTAVRGGVRTDATYSASTGGATGTMTVLTQGAFGNDVLLFDQPDGAKNGPWEVHTGTWYRHLSYDTDAEFVPGFTVFVREGTEYGGWNFQFKNALTPTLEVSMLNFAATSRDDVDEAGAGLERSGTSIGLEPRSGVQGRRTNPTLELDQYGLPTVVTAGTVPTTFIEGLTFSRASDTAVTLRAGSAWVPGLDAVLEAPTDIAKTGLVLAANTIYYGYLWSNAGVADLELSTTAPAAPYRGIAKTKTGDTTRRYVGELLTDAAGAITIFAVRTWEQATETERGAAFLATQALVTGGTNDRAQLTPLKLKNEFDRRGLFTDAYCELTHSGNQAFSDQTFTSIVWDAEARDPRNWRVPAQPARVTPDQAGMYLATLYTAWPSPTSGVKRQRIRVSDITTLAFDGTDSTLSLNIQTTTALVYIGAGDYITADVWQNSGGNLNLGSARLTVARVV